VGGSPEHYAVFYVVVFSPLFNQDLGFTQAVKYLSIQQFISEARVEAFTVSVLPW